MLSTKISVLTSKKQFIILIAILSLLIAAVGYLFYKHQKTSIRQEKYNDLKTIADLKENQIQNWITDRRADVLTVTQSPFFARGVNQWLKDTHNVHLKKDILYRLQLIQKEHGFENIFLIDLNNHLLLSIKNISEGFHTLTKQTITELAIKKEIIFTDIYFDRIENRIYYDVIAPIIYNGNKTIAILLFRLDPNDYLYPLIETWPTLSKSAETILLRVEKDSVLFLSELCHSKNTALKLKIPLTQTKLPAVQAALGRNGIFEGIDYRGVEVLSDIRAIPGTNWFLEAKIDKSELYSNLYISAFVIAGFSFLLIIICGIGFGFIYRTRQNNLFTEVFKREKELNIELVFQNEEKEKRAAELVVAKEKAEEMSRLKSNFLANMSHELRTPLIGINGFSDILRQDIENPKLKEMAEIIFNSGIRLSETLNLILDLSKFESGNMGFTYQHIDIVRETEMTISTFKAATRKKGLYLKLSSNQPSIFINTDPRGFHSILNNLINNAIKYTNEGGIVVDIFLKDNFVEIKVIDSGIGIAKENHDIIFDEFRQVSEGYSRNFEGTGLGLNITKKIVGKFGGEISVESEPGKGSTFIVKLPVTNAEIAVEKNVIKKAPLAVTTGQKSVKPLVLLVDDDLNVCPVLNRYIGGQIDLESTPDGEFAVKLCRQKQYNYIFMDINLCRGMDGKQTAQAIRKIKGYERIPIIALTAYAMAGDKEEFLTAGCSHYLSKPFGQQEISNLLEEISKGI